MVPNAKFIEGDPTVSILEFAKRNGVDLIALTSHGAGGEEIHSLGEVALKTLLSAKTSVLIVRSFNPVFEHLEASEAVAAKRGYRQVLVPLDGSLRAEAALPYAARLSSDDGDCLHLVSVVRPTIPWPAGAVNEDEEQARAAVAAAGERARQYLQGVAKAVAVPQRQLKTAVIDGDDIVFVNYVVTNHGDPLDLGSLLVAVTPRYDDWPYMQGMDSITDSDLTEEMGVNRTALAPGQMPDPIIYTLGTGESFSVGDNFHHQPNSPITFSARYTPVDDEGDMLHDERVEGEAAATIE